MQSEFTKNYFELFGLPPAFRIETARLESAYRQLQSQVHPDRFAAATDAEKRISMQWATRANEAYQTLKRPLSRARYLLALRGVDTQEETNTAMPTDFLIAQMEWREAVSDARANHDLSELDRLSGELRASEGTLLIDLEKHLDGDRNLPAAALEVRKLRFVEKLRQEIADAHEVMEN
jgi:molecular chaperone HscB